jgi:hypothetical protein
MRPVKPFLHVANVFGVLAVGEWLAPWRCDFALVRAGAVGVICGSRIGGSGGVVVRER